LVAVEHLGEETRPVKSDRRAVHVHAQVVVAVTNGITTARAIIQLGGHLVYLQWLLG
jgi:predicted RNase H-like nuclease (RuvC/YqgF family)